MKDDDNNNQARTNKSVAWPDPAEIPLFAELDDELEEPDRDTDYAVAFQEELIDEIDELDKEIDEALDYRDIADSPEQESVGDDFKEREDNPSSETTTDNELYSSLEAEDWQADHRAEPDDSEVGIASINEFEEEDREQVWQEEECPSDGADSQTWPPLLIAIAVLALLLVGAGGYGVLQQRSATHEEIRQLQAALATSIDPAEVTQDREALAGARQRNSELQTVIDVLTAENRRLTDVVAGLESQSQAQQVTTAASTATPQPGDKAQAATPIVAPVQAEQVSSLSTGKSWFVNFASYGVQERAERWANQLQPSSGRAMISTGSKNGRTYYRVRIVDLPSRAAADRVASELATEHDLAQLWVGRQ